VFFGVRGKLPRNSVQGLYTGEKILRQTEHSDNWNLRGLAKTDSFLSMGIVADWFEKTTLRIRFELAASIKKLT
jgi:hypothetical protein